MAASNPQLWQTVKSSRRLNHDGENEPVAVQIAGADPQMMAQAAVFNISKGARVIDINMGCPVKKVCNVASGSALLRHEDLVARILETVVQACTPFGIPVTLKTRTGWDREHRNALRIAYLAQETGIAALTLHGRTRADLYLGEAEYDTIREVKASISIPVVANGDIDSPEKARAVLAYTGADAVMIGSPLSSALEAPARGFHWGMATFHPTLPRGARVRTEVRGSLREILLGPATENDGRMNLFGALRTSMATCGYETLKEFQKAEIMLAPSLQTEGKQLQRSQGVGMGH
jgi:tRNA-dihydrouridine synthase B